MGGDDVGWPIGKRAPRAPHFLYYLFSRSPSLLRPVHKRKTKKSRETSRFLLFWLHAREKKSGNQPIGAFKVISISRHVGDKHLKL